jgi:hypothetical protein
MNIGFWTNQLCIRGVSVAVYDYAYFNQTMLGNKSIIFYEKHNDWNSEESIKKFGKEFLVIPVETFQDVDKYIQEHNIPILYNIKSGKKDGKLSKIAKNIIHCVFDCSEPHGEVYCSVSQWVPHNNGKFPTLPHIVTLPEHIEDMRDELNIPTGATVFGRHGGVETFDVIYVQSVVYGIALNRPDIYFLFLNTDKFCPPLGNIIHIDRTADLYEKRKFINTCDAMIWARSYGETFGLAIAEFSVCNKPVIASKVQNGDNAHYYMLGEKGIWYQNEQELLNILLNFDKNMVTGKDWNAYGDYSPEKVMKIFEEIVNNI